MLQSPALSTVEFLHRVWDVFALYFGGEVTPKALTDNFSTAYQLLEEMLDNGHPLITEPNALASLIAPPTIAGKMASFIVGKTSNVSDTLGEGAMSVIPWRRGGNVKYLQNEIFFDLTEEIDALYDGNGTLVSSDVRGTITCNCHLSGVPDLTLMLTNTGAIEDCSFHPCVRYSRWEREQVVSFVPPDGPFTLMTYRLSDRNPSSIPLVCRPSVSWRTDGTGRASFALVTKPVAGAFSGSSGSSSRSGGLGSSSAISSSSFNSMASVTNAASSAVSAASAALTGTGDGSSVEEVKLVVSFPKAVKSTDLSLQEGSPGSITTDPRTGDITWSVRALPRDPSAMGPKTPELSGNMFLPAGTTAAPIESVHATLHYFLPNNSVSGIGVRDLVMVSSGLPEKYKFFKGVKTAVKSGRITVRT
jgi:AP-3 complex subunit mu